MDIIFQELSPAWIIGLMFVAFAAGYIDAVAGGGGMLQLPALLFVGVPPVAALATNKIVGFTGTLLAVIKYSLEKKVYWKIIYYAAIPCLVASYFGSQVAMLLNSKVLTWMMLLCIPIALFFVLRKNKDHGKQKAIDSPSKTIAAIAPIGFYDGLLGPGTGSYMAIAINRFLKHDFLTATASVKPLNLLTNLGAALAFLIAGKVIWMIALPMAGASALGGWLGGKSAIMGGETFIRKVLIAVLVVMLLANIAKMIF